MMKYVVRFSQLLIIGLIVFGTSMGRVMAEDKSFEISIFNNEDIFFAPDSVATYSSDSIVGLDNGRTIARSVAIPDFTTPVRIFANIVLKPIPKDEVVVFDKWDRAGNIRLMIDGQPPIEMVKFITSYGGRDEHRVDISQLAPLLKGERRIEASVDTWVNPAWKIDLSIEFSQIEEVTEDSLYIDYVFNPDWVASLFYDKSITAEKMDSGNYQFEIEIPDSLQRIVMNLLTSGHCTDGSGADEFVPKDHIIYVDGEPVYRFLPWRDDCRRFRENNPYTRRWSDGSWSSDYSRSDWCPGDVVLPTQIDLSDHLTPGKHTVRLVIENIRPKDKDNNFGYWRTSAYLLGWKGMVRTVKW